VVPRVHMLDVEEDREGGPSDSASDTASDVVPDAVSGATIGAGDCPILALALAFFVCF